MRRLGDDVRLWPLDSGDGLDVSLAFKQGEIDPYLGSLGTVCLIIRTGATTCMHPPSPPRRNSLKKVKPSATLIVLCCWV